MIAKRPAKRAPVPRTRPWLSHYDRDVPHSLDYPAHPVHGFLSASAAKYPDRACTISGDEVWSYRQVEDAASALAGALCRLGVLKGDRVGILMPNIPPFVPAFYGILKAGAVVVALNPLGTAAEYAYQLRDSGTGILIVDENLYPALARQPDVLDGVRCLLVRSPNPSGYASSVVLAVNGSPRAPVDLRRVDLRLGSLLEDYKTTSVPLPVVETNDTALFQYSGGTTGPSKAAVATHRGVAANTVQFRRWLASLVDGHETFLLAIPLYHAYGMIAGMSLGIAVGATLALVPNPRDIDALLTTIRDLSPTVFPGVPGLYNALANHPDVTGGRVNLSSVRVCISGSTALMNETKERFERLSGGRICEGYGLSEAPVVTHCNPLRGTNKIGSIGMPMPDVDCRIVDPDRGIDDVAPGAAGELILRGPQLMREYHNNPAETAAALRRLDDQQLWLFTGDIARVDDDGYFYIVDRKKDVIKAGGLQVWPRDVEEVLVAHPAVLEVGVAGVRDPAHGEMVKAWIVLRPEFTVSGDELRAWCRDRLPSYKIPADIEFRSHLPKSNVGKILRRELVQQDAASRGQETGREA